MIFLCAILYAVATAVLASLGFAFAQGGLTHTGASLSLGIGALVAALTFFSYRHHVPHRRKLGPWEWAAVALFTLFALRGFLWVVFFSHDEIRVLSPTNLGDLPLHLTYIRSLANGIPFWPANPILTGTQLTYPLGVDLLQALVYICGGDLYRTFIWLGLGGAALTGIALWRWGGAFALAGFLGNGGLAGALIFFTRTPQDFQAEIAWKSIPLALFITQRGFLFALPAGLLLLCSWRRRYFPQVARVEGEFLPLPLWGELLLYASLPLFHLHTFLFLSLLLAGWFLLHAPARRSIAWLVGLALVPATFLVCCVTGIRLGIEFQGAMPHFHWQFPAASTLGWQPGWMQNDPASLAACQRLLDAAWPGHAPVISGAAVPIVFWFFNFGLWPLLLIWTLISLFRPGRAAKGEAAFAQTTLVMALALFLLCCFVKFAVWEWDNTKLMIWSYLIALPILWRHVLSRWPALLRAGAVALLFFSGLLSTFGGLVRPEGGYPIASRSELEALDSALTLIPPTERFIAHPTYNHPLLLLGRPLALGYPGHVHSHGYDSQEPQTRIFNILNGLPETEWHAHALASGCRYLFWGRLEAEETAYAESTQPWREKYRAVAGGNWGVIYDLKAPLPAPPAAP